MASLAGVSPAHIKGQEVKKVAVMEALSSCRLWTGEVLAWLTSTVPKKARNISIITFFQGFRGVWQQASAVQVAARSSSVARSVTECMHVQPARTFLQPPQALPEDLATFQGGIMGDVSDAVAL